MIYLTKEINKIILIDMFLEDERLDPLNIVTSPLSDFLIKQELKVESFYPASNTDVIKILTNIYNKESKSLIIHFIGHGSKESTKFGNSEYHLDWCDIKDELVQINNKLNDSLIVNTTLMCFGHEIFKLNIGANKPFFAAIGITSESSLRALEHNKLIYRNCLKHDRAESSIQYINDVLFQSTDKEEYYKLQFGNSPKS